MHPIPLFQLQSLAYRIGTHSILKALSFEIISGEFLVILGRSGSGKSTLLRMLNALNSPSEGEIHFRGQPLENAVQDLRKKVGILFQNPVVFNGSIRENLLIAGRWDPAIAQTPEAELQELLQEVGLKQVSLNQNARDLSGGEQQRIALARTLMNHPQVLLLDEPTSNLDPKLSKAIMDQINRLRKSLNLTIVAVSHDHQLMRSYADRVVLLSQGELAGLGSFAALDQAQLIEKAGLLAEDTPDAG